MSKKFKQEITNNYQPSAKKIPRVNAKLSDDTKTISWRFSKVDRNGSWKCSLKLLNEEKVKEIIRKLHDLDSMTWGDLKGKRNHSIPVSGISKTAQKRLTEIQRDDIDDLFSIGLCGKERVFGIRDGDVFNILWWDPNHTVCPSIKKHT